MRKPPRSPVRQETQKVEDQDIRKELNIDILRIEEGHQCNGDGEDIQFRGRRTENIL